MEIRKGMQWIPRNWAKSKNGNGAGKGCGEGKTWLAQSVKQVTLNLRVVSLNPTLRVEFTLKKKMRIED